jgi:hypothetical protein
MNPSDKFSIYAQKRQPLEGYFDVIAHGVEIPGMATIKIRLETLGRSISIDHRVLAKLLKGQKKSSEKFIRLLSCSTGNELNAFAQNLANKLKKDVLAPSDTIWASGNKGSFSISPMEIITDPLTGKVIERRPKIPFVGEWRNHNPKGNLENTNISNHGESQKLSEASQKPTLENSDIPLSTQSHPLTDKSTSSSTPSKLRQNSSELHWPPEHPIGSKPRLNDAGASDWRYQRYLRKQYSKGKTASEVLSKEKWIERYFHPVKQGYRPGRVGGPVQVKAKETLKSEGIRIVENVEIGGRYPDGVRAKPKQEGGGFEYYEVGTMLKKGTPEARERVKIEDELKAINNNDSIIFVDKNNTSKRITYSKGDSTNSKVVEVDQ